jgi:hypothetical protein
MRAMNLRLLCLLGLGACTASETDTRPETAAYISEAIIIPYCGRAACHSTDTAEHNYVLDTVDAAVAAMKDGLVYPGSTDRSQLYRVIVGQDTVMPPDSPLPDRDISLIQRWIDDGAAGLQ